MEQPWDLSPCFLLNKSTLKSMEAITLFQKGGLTMVPLFCLSILSIATILERLWFWFQAFREDRKIIDRVLRSSASNEWATSTQLANKEKKSSAIARFLCAPLNRKNPDPETFKLALESSAEDELTLMQKGDKILESIIAVAPLLGLLGTVLGLMRSLSGIEKINIGTAAGATVATGISESLISTATGMIVAILSLSFYRLFQSFIFTRVKLFQSVGNQLELLYREYWLHQKSRSNLVDQNSKLSQ